MEVFLFSSASCGLQSTSSLTMDSHRKEADGMFWMFTPTPTPEEGPTSAQKPPLRPAPFRELDEYCSC